MVAATSSQPRQWILPTPKTTWSLHLHGPPIQHGCVPSSTCWTLSTSRQHSQQLSDVATVPIRFLPDNCCVSGRTGTFMICENALATTRSDHTHAGGVIDKRDALSGQMSCKTTANQRGLCWFQAMITHFSVLFVIMGVKRFQDTGIE